MKKRRQNTNLFDPWPLTLTPKVIWKNGAKIETYTWSSGKSIKIETPAWRPWIPTPLTFDLDPKGHMKKRRQNRNLHLETRKINRVRIFSHPCLAPMDRNLHLELRKINRVRIFSHPCLAPMDTNLFDPWPLTLNPKVIWKNGAKIKTYTWSSGKSIKFEFFLTPAWRPWIPTYLTHDLWPWPQRSYEKTAPKSKLTPGAQENQ